MLHTKVSGCAEGERGDRGVGTEKALIVAMVGNTVCAVGVVVDEAEIVGCFGEDLGELAQMVKTVGHRAGSAGFVAVWRYRFGCLAVNEAAICGERRRGINPEYRGETRSVYMSLGTIALNGVLHPVEEEEIPQKFEQLSFSNGRDIRLEVEEVEIGLIIYFVALRSWHFVQLLDNVWWKVRNGERIGCVIGNFGAVDWVYLEGRRFCSHTDLLLRGGREEVVEGPFLRHLCLW